MAHLNLVGSVVFVGHNWGVSLAMDWAMRNPQKTVGLVHIEGQISPITTAIAGDRFRAFNAHMHSPEMERQVLEENLYLDHYFFRYVQNILSDEDRAVYQKPYLKAGHGRRPTIDWPCEIPVDGEPSDVFEKLNDLKAWMSKNDLPKLWIIPNEASIMTGERKQTAEAFSCQTVLEIEGGHYTPETSPDAVGRAISEWLIGLKR